jgi:hypothetical protein
MHVARVTAPVLVRRGRVGGSSERECVLVRAPACQLPVEKERVCNYHKTHPGASWCGGMNGTARLAPVTRARRDVSRRY